VAAKVDTNDEDEEKKRRERHFAKHVFEIFGEFVEPIEFMKNFLW